MKIYDIAIIVFNKIDIDARALNLANSLINMGYKVIVFSITSENKQKYSFDNIEISIKYSKKLILNWIRFYFEINKIIKNYAFAYLVCSDLYSLANSYNIDPSTNIIYDSREFYSSLASLKNRPITQKIITGIEKFLLKKVDKVIVTSQMDKEYLSKISYFDKPFYIIKNLPPLSEDSKSDYIRIKYNLPQSSFIIIYQGMISYGRGIFSILEAIKNIDNVYFFIIGDSIISNQIKSKAESLQISDRIIIENSVPYNKLRTITSSADIGIALFEPLTESYKYALPNKLFEYATANIPVIATNLPAIKDVVSTYNIGILIEDVYNFKEIELRIKEILKEENYNLYKNNILAHRNKFFYETQLTTIKELFL